MLGLDVSYTYLGQYDLCVSKPRCSYSAVFPQRIPEAIQIPLWSLPVRDNLAHGYTGSCAMQPSPIRQKLILSIEEQKSGVESRLSSELLTIHPPERARSNLVYR